MKSKLFWNILFAFLVLLPKSAININAQSELKAGNEITVSKVPAKKIEKYRQDNDFKYLKDSPAIDFKGIVIAWILKFLEAAFSDRGPAPYIRYAIFILVTAFVISKLVGSDFNRVYSSNKKISSKNLFKYGIENINEIDFDQEIRNAIKKQNYRLATRFYYLKLLKILNDMQYINWQAGKTNSHYRNELSNTSFIREFDKFSWLYEYSWYGHFEISSPEYKEIAKDFEQSFISIKDKN